MSDSMDSFDSLANMTTSGDDPLPPDLEPLHHRVLQDSTLWRAGLPGTGALARQVTLLSQRKPESRLTSYHIQEELHMQDPTQIDPSTHQHRETGRTAHPRSRSFLAGGAALVLVALFAALFGVLSHNGQTPHNTGPAAVHPTATATTPTSQHGKWQPVASLTHTPGVPVIAPSNTSVVYEITNGAVRRSTDGGATWTNLPNPADFPAGDTPQWMDLFVSPLNPDTVWTIANLTNPNGAINCPVPPPFGSTGSNVAAGSSDLYSENINNGGTVPCQVQNVSTDGGRTWKLVKLSFGYMLGTDTPDGVSVNSYDQYSQTPLVQGSRLYTLTTSGPLASSASAGHIASSSDGGVTWHDASAQLTNAGLHICDIAAVPDGTALYAVTADTGCGPEYNPTLSLWVSSDGGGQWTQRALPSGRLVSSLAVSGGAHPTLYALMSLVASGHAVTSDDIPTSVFASTDGGKTWKQSPAAGAPHGVVANGPMTALDDGSIVLPLGVTNPQNQQSVLMDYTFSQWQPGSAAWHPLSHLTLYSIAEFQTLPDHSTGADVLWLTAPDSADPQSSTFSVETYLP